MLPMSGSGESSLLMTTYRSSHQTCSIIKGGLRNFAKFTGKHLCQSLFFNKVTGLRPATLLKKGLWHRCFLLNFAKFPRTPFLQNLSGRLLLYLRIYMTSYDENVMHHESMVTCIGSK